MKRIIDQIERQHYISPTALRRLARSLAVSALDGLQTAQIVEKIRNGSPDVGVLSGAEASSCVKDGTLYSIRWAEAYSPVGTVAEKIGHHLWSVLREDWGNGDREGVAADALKARHLDGLICDLYGIPDFSGFRKWCERICLPRPLREDYLKALDLEALGEIKEALRILCDIAERGSYAPAEYHAARLLMPCQHPTAEGQLADALFGRTPSSILAEEYAGFPDAGVLAKRACEHGYPCALYSRGKKVGKDRPEEAQRDFDAAKRLILHFADLGDEEAIRCAAEMFERGLGFDRNADRAKELRDELKRREAEKEMRRQQRSCELYEQALGLLSEMDGHVAAWAADEDRQYLESVVLLLERATRLGNPYAEWKLGTLVKEMNPDSSARYCDEARDALTAMAAGGDAKARDFIASSQD